MTETTVQYHSDRAAYPAQPAINVKVRSAGASFWPPESVFPVIGDKVLDGDNPRWERYVEYAYERVQSDFWQAASEIATQRGLGEITQEGRSGGWLVFTDGRDPQDGATFCEDRQTGDEHEGDVAEWLAAYRSMVEWADTWIADAPRKVRDLAQQLAMDEAGEPAALRMFAFGRTA